MNDFLLINLKEITDMDLIEKLELDNVDLDIREAYLPYIDGRYKTGEPTEIQTVRLLRQVNENLVELLKIYKPAPRVFNLSGIVDKESIRKLFKKTKENCEVNDDDLALEQKIEMCDTEIKLFIEALKEENLKLAKFASLNIQYEKDRREKQKDK